MSYANNLPMRDTRERERHDSSSTFFGAGRSSAELLRSPATPGVAGYNRQSFYVQPERVEPVRWGGSEADEEKGFGLAGKGEDGDETDVYADFNNAGRRLVPLGDAGTGRPTGAAPARPQYSASPFIPPTSSLLPGAQEGGPMEYVTVPTLGPDWHADELREMTRKGRTEARFAARARKWRAWIRDEEGVFGKWGRRKSLVWAMFALACVVGILLAILLPRVPDIQLYGNEPLSSPANASTDSAFFRVPANFSFASTLALQVDTSSQVALPLQMTSLWATVWDTDTNVAVGTGSMDAFSVPAKQYTPIELPLLFQYAAVNASDATWAAFRNACSYEWTGTTRPGLNLRLQIFMKIAGLIPSYQTAVSLSSVPCPIVLPENAA
ncbi:hypothetical protein CALCODRAFT_496397 [Calocera cornea HHB12733]|uniref:Transmembrane protein n=1 Tax=Calocera cornea HHB12733 TaxID=1353952 RepID=A0A165FVT0_9BASI|nr:hypothetical protein CALCODRAFT_496397 [Calocera cornea HHB12733]